MPALEAKEPLRAEPFITVDNGRVIETGILTDDKGIVFVELLEHTRVNRPSDKQPFIGDILPPAILDLDIKRPRTRMRTVLSFELLTDTAEGVTFTDQFNLMHPKAYLREVANNPDGLQRSGGVKILTQLNDSQEFGAPALWRYDLDTEEWSRLGGTLTDTAVEEIKVFSAIIAQTGLYAILDEDPAPYYAENTPLETIEPAEESPFPSVSQEQLGTDETFFTDDVPFENDLFQQSEEPLIGSSPQPSNAPTGNPLLAILPSDRGVTDTRIIPAVIEGGLEAENVSEVVNEESLEGARLSAPVQGSQDDQVVVATTPIVPDIPKTGRLPETGIASDLESQGKAFPLALVLALVLIGTSIFLARQNRFS